MNLVRLVVKLLLLLVIAFSTANPKPVPLALNATEVSPVSTNSGMPHVEPAKPVWSWKVAWRTPPIGHRFAAEPLVMDLNADGADEIVLAGFDGAFSVLDASDGRFQAGGGAWPRFHHGEAHFATPLRFDVDQDGEEELIFVSYSGALHYYSQTGALKHEDQLPSVEVPTLWLASATGTLAQLLDSPSSVSNPDVPIVVISNRPFEGDGVNEMPKSERLLPSVFASPVLCDCDADGSREEFALSVSFVGERRLVSALLIYSLRLKRTLVWHWLEHSWLSSARPGYLFSTPLWIQLSTELTHNSLIVASASGRLFAYKYESSLAESSYFKGQLRSVTGFPVLFGSLIHPPLLLSGLQPGQSVSTASATSTTSNNVLVVLDSASGQVSGLNCRGQIIWSTTRLSYNFLADSSILDTVTPLTAFYRAGRAYAVAFSTNPDHAFDTGPSSVGRLHLISAANGELHSLDTVLAMHSFNSSASNAHYESGPHRRHNLVPPMSRLTPLVCRGKPHPGREDSLLKSNKLQVYQTADYNRPQSAYNEAADIGLLAGVDWLGRIVTIALTEDAGFASVSYYNGLNATTALGLSGVNSERTGLADLAVLTTDGRVVKLGYRLEDKLTGLDCDLRMQESLSIRIPGAPYIEQSGSTLILPIFIEDLLNTDGLMSMMYTVHVYLYNKETLTLRYTRPGPHLMYFDAGSRPLKSQLLLRLTNSADARSAESQATLVANVNYVYEMPFLLYLPVGVTLLLLLGQVFTVEDNLVLPFVARHTE